MDPGTVTDLETSTDQVLEDMRESLPLLFNLLNNDYFT